MLLWTSLCASTPLQGVSKRSVSPWCRELEELLFLLLLGYGGVQKPAVSCKVRPLCSCVVFVGFLNYHSISSAAWFSDSCGGVGFFVKRTEMFLKQQRWRVTAGVTCEVSKFFWSVSTSRWIGNAHPVSKWGWICFQAFIFTQMV